MADTYKYHTLYRAPGPGCQPRDGMIEAKDYGQKMRISERAAAWGEVTYDRPLTEKEIQDYELLPAADNKAQETSA